jgi:nitrogen fixation protein NifZ
MSDSAQPKFQWGQPVWTVVDLVNDGSYPGKPESALLVASGDRGEVVQVGAHVETNTTVYLVEFSGSRVVGCLEDEIDAMPPTIESQTL